MLYYFIHRVCILYIYIYIIFHILFCIQYFFLNKFLKHGINTHHTFFIRLKFKIKYPTLLLRFFKFLHCMNRNAPMFKLTWFLRLTHNDFPGLNDWAGCQMWALSILLSKLSQRSNLWFLQHLLCFIKCLPPWLMSDVVNLSCTTLVN
jgi:hypothetical protein